LGTGPFPKLYEVTGVGRTEKGEKVQSHPRARRPGKNSRVGRREKSRKKRKGKKRGTLKNAGWGGGNLPC